MRLLKSVDLGRVVSRCVAVVAMSGAVPVLARGPGHSVGEAAPVASDGPSDMGPLMFVGVIGFLVIAFITAFSIKAYKDNKARKQKQTG